MREAPSLVILPMLQAQGARIRAYDPEGAREAAKLLDIELCADAYEALADADGVVILTEWNAFRALDLARVKSLLRHPLMIDLRNIYPPQQMADAGFTYVSVGRATGRGREVSLLAPHGHSRTES
jgi:UDPglucose 6-dehydrogenase